MDRAGEKTLAGRRARTVSIVALGPLGKAARVLHILILSLWLGACAFFIFIMAPTVFEVIPSRHDAGNVVTAALMQIDLFGLVSGPLLLVTTLIGWLPLGTPIRLRSLAALVMTAAAGISRQWLTPEMIRLREAMGARIEAVDAEEPLKIAFSRLHAVSTTLMVLHAGLALALLVYAIAATTPKRRYGIEL